MSSISWEGGLAIGVPFPNRSINHSLCAERVTIGRRSGYTASGDHFYSIDHSRKNFSAFENGGGHGKFFEFNMPADIGHNVIHYPDLWASPVGEYLDSLPGGHRT